MKMRNMKILKFYADWCNPCKRETELLEDLKTVPVVSLNIDESENQDLVEKYSIKSLPTLVLLKDEEVLKTWVGITTPNVINNFIKKHGGDSANQE